MAMPWVTLEERRQRAALQDALREDTSVGPRMYCPRHMLTGMACRPWCLPARVEFAQSTADLRMFWTSKYWLAA